MPLQPAVSSVISSSLSLFPSPLSLHSFPVSPNYLRLFSVLSASLSLSFPVCFSSLLISLHSYPALRYIPLRTSTVFSPPSTLFPLSP